MIEKNITITCKKCGGEDIVVLGDSPDDELELIACEMSINLIEKSICDTCKKKEQLAWYQRTQVFEITGDDFKIPKEHQEYKRELASEEGITLKKEIGLNIDQNLYISGEYDLGKSKAVCAGLMYLKSQNHKRVHYIGFNEMINAYSTFAKDESKDKADKYLKSLLKCDYLVVDDFCKKRLSYSNCEAMFQLSEYIYSFDHECKVWITANFGYEKALKKWEDEDLGRATFSRFLRCGFMQWNSEKRKFDE